MATKDEIDKRGQWILGELLREGSITIEKICQECEASLATARRDLDSLEKKGRLRRNHGGAISFEALLYEPFRHVSTFKDQV